MERLSKSLLNFVVIIGFGLLPAIICQFFLPEPIDRYIHVTSFRYGKDPSVIRCNRGDRLHLTFSSDDTGHSFFLEEFDMDVKVNPASREVAVFKISDPTSKPVLTREVVFSAKHTGLFNFVVSKSNYRCHTWCGPMHAFEQGKLIILPNTSLIFSLGCLIGMLFLWWLGIFRNDTRSRELMPEKSGYRDLLKRSELLKKFVLSRWPQLILIFFGMLMIYIVILTSVFGTKVSGRNLGVLLMWAIWLFLLVAILTPFGGRLWCTICPLPVLGDYLQRRSFSSPIEGQTNKYNNKFFGLFLKWPGRLSNNWLKLIMFLLLTTFSTTLVGIPKVSGLAVLFLFLVPTFMALLWELRAFCRYVCPVGVFVGAYSKMSVLAIRNKSQKICDQCKPNYCQRGSEGGWACPYGLNVGELKENFECGLCLECTRSCLYKNVSLYRKPFGSETETRSYSEAWLNIALFTLSIVYSVLYLGPWPEVRDYVNIMDKQNWDLFGIFVLTLWLLVLIIVPGVLYFLSAIGTKLSRNRLTSKDLFLVASGALLPLGLMLWIAFVIPMLFVNKTFILQSMSDPFGWGWDFFGTANIPWHQFLPQFIPWFQAILLLSGLSLSLGNIRIKSLNSQLKPGQFVLVSLPIVCFLVMTTIVMLFFFTN
jgi:polyferredoxin